MTRTDFKDPARKVASRKEWDAIVGEKDGPCRCCGGKRESFHHLVPRSQRGDDVAANVVSLCGSGTTGCHGILTQRLAGWQVVAAAIRHSLTPLEERYVVAKKGRWWLDREYPHSDDGLCAKCRKPRAPKRTDGEPRKRKRWVVSVPDDAENGAEVLDALLAAARLKLRSQGLDVRDDTPPYFVLVPVFHDWLEEAA